MSEWQHAQIEINGHLINYWRTDGDKLPILMLHGFTEDSSTWKELAEALESRYDVIMPDFIGHGESSRLPADGKIDLVKDLEVFIDALGLQKAGLIGHSLGAAIAAEYAAKHIEKVAALVLEEVPWFDPSALPKIPQEAVSSNNPTVIAQLAKSSLQEALTYSREHHPSWNEAAHQAWAGSKTRFDAEWFKINRPPQTNWQEIAAKITCPTLILNGQTSLGSLLSSAVVIKALKIMPALEWSNIAGAGHFIHYDKPVPYIPTVKEFLTHNYAPKKA